MRRPKREIIEDTDSNAFITGWADTVTLLLVFFVYIISISSIDIAKLFKATESFKREVSSTVSYERELVIPELTKKLQSYVKEEQLENEIKISGSINDILINFGDRLLFDSASAKLTPRGEEILKEIAAQLNVSGILIRIEGHTDNRPISNDQFPSNWHLSAYRSAEVVGYLVSNGVDPKICEIIGFSDTKPIDKKNTNEARAKNRRVLLLIKESYSNQTNEIKIGGAV